MMQNQEQTVLLISDDATFCATARVDLEGRKDGLRVAAVSTLEAAHRIVADAAPAVILLEENSAAAESPEHPVPGARLELAASALAAYAPVVVIGQASHRRAMAALIAAGQADFVARSGGCLLAALDLVEQRLLRAPKFAAVAMLPVLLKDDGTTEAFGEVLRHELNNPLTGILGNAELLLAEVRRKNDGQLPNGGQQRLETIAALAVRLRETVRRLSQDWETRNRIPQRPAQPRIAH
jgi:signal transduction histidine kinase